MSTVEHHPPPGRGRPRAGDPGRDPRRPGGRRLRPADDGRGGHPGPCLQSDALPALEQQGQPRHRRPALAEGAPAVPDTGHAARRPARDVLRHGRPHRRAPDGDPRQRDHRDRPRRRLRRGLPPRLHRPQDRASAGRSTSARRSAARSARTSTSTCSRPPCPASSSTALFLMGQPPTEEVDHPGDRPSHHPRRHQRHRPHRPPSRKRTHDRRPRRHRRRPLPEADSRRSLHLGWALVLISSPS